jgi:exopolysaccharide biosynthesis polyprenyl glycosylphosphotransferase
MITLLSIWRILKRLFVEYLVVHGYNNFNALIIGAGKVGMALLNEIEKRPGVGIKVIGFLDDFKQNTPEEPKIRILGKIADFVSIARREFITKVFITIHHDSKVFLKLLEEAKDLGVAMRVIPQGFHVMTCDFSKYNIGFIPILEYSEEYSFRKQVGKRLFDFCFGCIAFVFLMPVFCVLGILIKWDNPGPVFYKSRRYGRKGKIFNMYKFRSMVADADRMLEKIKHQNEMDGPIFKIKSDPRVTRMGRFLRKYSLDEMPQLINVIRGEMSLVGPRPLPIDQIEKEDLRQLERLEVKPGITGLWQIRGRSDLAFNRLLKWDLWYIDNWSFWLDLYILMQTLPVVFKGRGAY